MRAQLEDMYWVAMVAVSGRRYLRKSPLDETSLSPATQKCGEASGVGAIEVFSRDVMQMQISVGNPLGHQGNSAPLGFEEWQLLRSRIKAKVCFMCG